MMVRGREANFYQGRRFLRAFCILLSIPSRISSSKKIPGKLSGGLNVALKNRWSRLPLAIFFAVSSMAAYMDINSVNQPAQVLQNENFQVTVNFTSTNVPFCQVYYRFIGIMIPNGFTVNSMMWGSTVMPENLDAEDDLNYQYPPDPGYYWWAGENTENPLGTFDAVIDVTAGITVGNFLIDYRAGVYYYTDDPHGPGYYFEYGNPILDQPLEVIPASDGWVAWENDIYGLTGSAVIEVGDFDLAGSDTVSVNVWSTSDLTPIPVTLNADTSGSFIFHGSVQLGVELTVSDGDTITVEYIDADDGQGGIDVHKHDYAPIEGIPPVFAGLDDATAGFEYVNLSWSAASDPHDPITYNIYRAETPGGQNFLSPLASTTSIAYSDTAVINCNTYYYVVRAEDALGNEDTNTVELSETPHETSLGSDGSVSWGNSFYGMSDSATIEVIDVDLACADSVIVDAWSVSDPTPVPVSLFENPIGSAEFYGSVQLGVDISVVPGDTITAEYIDADDGLGGINVPKYDYAEISTPIFSGLESATPGWEYVDLSWSAATDPDQPITYNIYRADSPGGQNFSVPLDSTGSLGYIDASVTNCQEYFYVVRAEDSLGYEDYNTVELSATPMATEKTDTTYVGSYNTPGNCLGVYFSGDYAYIADGNSGLHIVNVSDPENPVLTGSYDTPGFARGVFVSGSYAYVADDTSGLQVIDVSDPSSPVPAGSYDTPGLALGVLVNDNLAYVTDEASGLQIIDVSVADSCTLVGSYNTPGLSVRVHVVGDYAYIADYDSGLQILDVSDPTSPSYVGSYNTSGQAYGIYVSGDYAYVADMSAGLKIIDVSNPSSPFQEGSFDTYQALSVVVKGEYAYLADRDVGGVKIIDVSDPSAPFLFSSYNTMGDTRDVFVEKNYAYVADGFSGLIILDITILVPDGVVFWDKDVYGPAQHDCRGLGS